MSDTLQRKIKDAIGHLCTRVKCPECEEIELLDGNAEKSFHECSRCEKSFWIDRVN